MAELPNVVCEGFDSDEPRIVDVQSDGFSVSLMIAECWLTDIEELKRLEAAAFKGPWEYTRFAIECIGDDNGDDVGNGEHDCISVEAHDEYPDGQCVCQQNILVPGLERFAEANGALIVAARNALPDLLAELEALRAVAAALPKCEGCDAPATGTRPRMHANGSLSGSPLCDSHKHAFDDELPYAAAIRALVALKGGDSG